MMLVAAVDICEFSAGLESHGASALADASSGLDIVKLSGAALFSPANP